jgi:hypothetical protein
MWPNLVISLSGSRLRRLGRAALVALFFAGVHTVDVLGGGGEPQPVSGRAVGGQASRPPGGVDLTGVWRSANARLATDLSAAGRLSPLQPWGVELYKERQRTGGVDRPSARCLPRGLPGSMLAPDAPWKIVQTPGVIVILFDQSLHYRQIFTDGRGFPEEVTPNWFGYSIGSWEGDTLVVQSIGFNDQTWLDEGGHPHSADMRLTERFRRKSQSRLEVQLTVDDSKAYVKPWTVALGFDLRPEVALTEHVCAAHPVQ